MNAQAEILADAMRVLRDRGLIADGDPLSKRDQPQREWQIVQEVSDVIESLPPEAWDALTHQQRQILLIARATVRHHPGAPGLARAWW
ncbi:hypothetical protein SPF06_13135 [Sinomonas sp. JGH33]|uniref:Uncharacterized protein n=1 Tax=Sinomonas terricola TaxID=3110330 RepID=A0ABU5T7I6_9MICC|nr:hypothetical protein [Sinomonas sp. JGH33]MEA5455671.1 hypothetical protein [Sinomonas sp. JGH33]